MDKFDVVAAIIIKDDKYFIAQRNRNKHMGLSWEFPGGKVEKGETFEIALKSCLLYTSPSPRDIGPSRMPSSA